MRIIFIIFVLFLVSCSTQEEPRTQGLHRKKKIFRKTDMNSNTITKRAKVISRTLNINPFLTKEEEASIHNSYEKPLSLRLSAIFYSPPNSKAIIDGRILKEGDKINNKIIKEIKLREVILKDSNSKYILRIEGLKK